MLDDLQRNHVAEGTAMARGMHDGPQPIASSLVALSLPAGFPRICVGKHYPSAAAGGASIAAVCDSPAGRVRSRA